MAKQQRSVKNTQVQHVNGNGVQQEHTEVFDDNLLPDATEIKELHSIDPNIMEWLKERAEKEQDFRHKYAEKRTDILECNVKGELRINTIGLIFAFLIIISGMCLSAFLVYLGHVVTGTIFSGLSIIYAAALFIRRNKTNEKKQNRP